MASSYVRQLKSGNALPFEFCCNTQSWQYWHFCTTSNENELKTVKYQISFQSKFTFVMVLGIKIKVISLSNFVSNLSNAKNVNVVNFVYYGKTRLNFAVGNFGEVSSTLPPGGFLFVVQL